MSISPRQVKNKRDANGMPTGRPGTVYDVNIKYKINGERKVYGKKGFLTKKEAAAHEAEMKVKLSAPEYKPLSAEQSKLTVQKYLEQWVQSHGKANLRPGTFDNYKSQIKNHIVPNIGQVQLRQLTPEIIDGMYQKLFDQGLSQSTVKYTQCVLSVALEAARKYHYINTNPANDIITKFGKQGKTPDPYTVEQMQQLMGNVMGTQWEMIVVLSGMYGLRRNEVLGLRWDNVDMKNDTFGVIEQLPYKVPSGTERIELMAPVKSEERTLPITEVTRPYFERQFALQEKQKEMARLSGQEYFDNRLVISKPNGMPMRAERVTVNFAQLLRRLNMPHIRFHDLRHSAATNMHQLTGDFYTVGKILGHSLKGVGIQLNMSSTLEAVTERYVDVRLERKKTVLDAYHNALHPQKDAKKTLNRDKKEMER